MPFACGSGRWVLPVAISLGGCSPGAPPATVVRDSVGIRIVDNAAPVGPTLTIDSIPTVDIGPEDGPGSEIPTTPVFAVRMNDGRIAATSWVRNDFTIFDAEGHWIKTVGRLGSGPGEFQRLGLLFRSAFDTLVTFEPENRRVQRWTSDGANIDLAPLLAQGQPGGWIDGVTDSGSLIVRSQVPDPATETALTLSGTVTVFRLDSLSATWTALFSYRSQPLVKHPGSPAMSIGPPLFEPSPTYHQRGHLLAFSKGDAFAIELRDVANGKLRTIIRRPFEARRLTDADVQLAAEARWQQVPTDQRQVLLKQLSSASSSRVRPPVGTILVAGDGRVWAITGDDRLSEIPRASVFDSTGVWESEVSLPKGLTIHQIDADGILGSIGDDQGYQHLKFFRYRRTPR